MSSKGIKKLEPHDEITVTNRPLVFFNFDRVLQTGDFWAQEVREAFDERRVDSSPELWAGLFDAAACRNFRSLDEEFSPEYVVASWWTNLLSHMKTTRMLCETGLEFIAQNLHKDWKTTPEKWRKYRVEVDWWLEDNPTARPFVIIQNQGIDSSFRKSKFADRAVYCSRQGFTEVELQQVRAILRKQLCSDCESSE